MDHCEYEADKFPTQPEKLWGFFDFALPTNKIIERQTCLKGKKTTLLCIDQHINAFLRTFKQIISVTYIYSQWKTEILYECLHRIAFHYLSHGTHRRSLHEKDQTNPS